MVLKKHKVKGQLTLLGLLTTFISLLVYAIAIYPILSQVIEDAGITGASGTLLTIMPLLILAGILYGFMAYISPSRPGGYY